MGKAKRFNPYDETVKASRERAKAFGEGRQKLAGITSPFRSSPLQPPIVTKLRGTGTGDGKFLTVSLAGDQTTNIAVNNHIEFDTKDEDGGIVLQTGAGQADGIFELLGGRKYYLQASLRPEFSGTTGQLEVAWFDQTNSAQIGSRAKYEAKDHSGRHANQPTAAALFTPATNVLVKLEILSVTALDGLANEYSLANLFEIALGGIVVGGGGGGGGGVTFPITPSINDHGNVGTVTEDIDIGASTGHVHKLTLTGNPTLTFSNPPSSGVQMEFEIEFVQDATGGRTITHPASVAETVTISTTASATTIITYRTNDNGTTYHAIPALRGSISLGSTAFATKELDNLGTTAINESLISDTDDTDDLGSASKEWKDLFIDGTANIDILSLGGNANFNNNEANNVKGIDFEAGGPTDTTTLPVIWADASGDMVLNVATADQFLFTIAGATRFDFSEGNAQFTSTDQNGVELILNNQDATPLDNDRAGRIRFDGDDDGGTQRTYGTIDFNMDDVSAGALQADYVVGCRSDNSLQNIIDYTGVDAVFRFASGVDVVRPNRDDAIDLGASGQQWKDLFINGTANIDTLKVDVGIGADIDFDGFDIQDLSNLEFRNTTVAPGQTLKAIYGDAGGMIYNVPDGDDFDWRVDNISQLKMSATTLDLQSNTITDCGSITPQAAGAEDLGIAAGSRWRNVFCEAVARDADNAIVLTTTGILILADQLDVNIGGGGAEAVFNATEMQFNTGYNIVMTSSSLDGYMELNELTGDAAAPAANRARLYIKDNGSGKTQLIVRFPTGAVQVLATQP